MKKLTRLGLADIEIGESPWGRRSVMIDSVEWFSNRMREAMNTTGKLTVRVQMHVIVTEDTDQ
jgi:hypothetical protein